LAVPSSPVSRVGHHPFHPIFLYCRHNHALPCPFSRDSPLSQVQAGPPLSQVSGPSLVSPLVVSLPPPLFLPLTQDTPSPSPLLLTFLFLYLVFSTSFPLLPLPILSKKNSYHFSLNLTNTSAATPFSFFPYASSLSQFAPSFLDPSILGRRLIFFSFKDPLVFHHTGELTGVSSFIL